MKKSRIIQDSNSNWESLIHKEVLELDHYLDQQVRDQQGIY
jgi:hypothetical protein